MRLYLVSLIVALACLLPEFAEVKNWDLPPWLHNILCIPSAGLGYMEVFFHELGHTAASWSFGEVAVPSFNFEDGGGVSVPLFDRSLILQGVVYAGLAGLCAWLAKEELYAAAGVLLVLAAIHVYFATGDRFRIAVSYMGHGGSVLVGCFCLVRAALNKTVSESSPELERYLNMTFGIFVVLSNVLLSWKIITDPISRGVYEAGIGGHLTNDFVAIAERMDTKVQRVAVFSLFFIAASLIASVIVYFIFREPPEDETTMPVARRRL